MLRLRLQLISLQQVELFTISRGTTGQISIDITDDQSLEGNKTFKVKLENPTNATLGIYRTVVTIWDDESLNTFSIFAVGGQADRSICGTRPSSETSHPLATGDLGANGCPGRRYSGSI